MTRLIVLGVAGLAAVAALLSACNGAGANDQGAVLSTPAPTQGPSNKTVAVSVPHPILLPSPVPERKLAPNSVPTGPASFEYTGEMTQGGWIRGQVPAGTVSARLGEQDLIIDQAGNFFAGFDRDTGTSVQLSALLADGRTQQETIAVNPRKWNLERINAARRTGGASASFMKRRQPELDAIWDARQEQTGSQGWQQKFIWPVKGRISGRFGSQRIYRGEPGSYHSGLDIAPGNGVAFVAPADGVVVLARTGFSLEGGLIIIDHGQGLNSAFLHASKLAVSKGQSVKQGQYIGNIGSSGRATGPHLHWSIKWNLARLDPLLFVGPQ